MNKEEFISIVGCHPEDVVGADWENIISEWKGGSIKIG